MKNSKYRYSVRNNTMRSFLSMYKISCTSS